MEVWKVQEEVLQPPKTEKMYGVGYKEERLIFPTIQPRSLEPPEPNLCNSTGKTKYEPFSIVALSVLPASFLLLTWPILGLKASLQWKRLRETFRNDAHGSQLCFPVVRSPPQQRHLKPRTPTSLLHWNPPSPLPHPWQSSRPGISVGR